MRGLYAHNARLRMDADADLRAPGAAITLALCGSWEHKPPCPLAGHHTSAERTGGTVRVKVIFATEPEHLAEVRRRMEDALSAESVAGPEGVVTVWVLEASGAGELAQAEREHARRLADG
ncbi:hypothetical protein J7E83_18380 [Arthrobacter sp. ISL-48]|uniref:hypothetical protein n=1 Tax=Arthrobacter sp. ISL-48 TaxID=2819110 RepID=UPI001BEACD11|nr:hypothetical protein [Arthrobacter sp. ISL-48]MBT2534055.1 hypothetical protein [Arthrobacter sp. ISL-48]